MSRPCPRTTISPERAARIEACLRERWGRASTSSIGNTFNVTTDVVIAVAERLGLGPNLWEAPGPVPAPLPPRGFTRAQVKWARAARTPEAALILGIVGELAPQFPRDPAAKGVGVQ